LVYYVGANCVRPFGFTGISGVQPMIFHFVGVTIGCLLGLQFAQSNLL